VRRGFAPEQVEAGGLSQTTVEHGSFTQALPVHVQAMTLDE